MPPGILRVRYYGRLDAKNPAKLVKPPLIDDRLSSNQERARAVLLGLLYTGLRVGDLAQPRCTQIERTGHLVLHAEKNGVPVKVLLQTDTRAALDSLPAPGGNAVHFFLDGEGDPTRFLRQPVS